MERSGRLDPSRILRISPRNSSSLMNDVTEAHTASIAPSLVSRLEDLPFQAVVQASRSDADFFDVLSACDHHGIATFEIDEIGTLNKPGDGQEYARKVFPIGSGQISEVVLHVTGSESKEVVPPGTVVALKTFTSSKLRNPREARARRQHICTSLLGEINAFSHPLLRGHENIVQLLFVGLTQRQGFPMLAMELGDYGSLDHIIRTSAPGLSIAQRSHITIDMALGLQAIHSAGFVHGDLKPDNVIVFAHPSTTRQMIAKITDFGGSVHESNGSTRRPLHHTPTWSPPEVLRGESELDWESADMYSYGVILGCLWGGIASKYEVGENKVDVEGMTCELDMPDDVKPVFKEYFKTLETKDLRELPLEDIIMPTSNSEHIACLGTFLAYRVSRNPSLVGQDIRSDIKKMILALVLLPPRYRPSADIAVRMVCTDSRCWKRRG